MSSTSRPHFGTDGIRGNADKDLTDEFVFALGQAISTAIFDEAIQQKSEDEVGPEDEYWKRKASGDIPPFDEGI